MEHLFRSLDHKMFKELTLQCLPLCVIYLILFFSDICAFPMKQKAKIASVVKEKLARTMSSEEGESTSGKTINASAFMQPLSPSIFGALLLKHIMHENPRYAYASTLLPFSFFILKPMAVLVEISTNTGIGFKKKKIFPLKSNQT